MTSAERGGKSVRPSRLHRGRRASQLRKHTAAITRKDLHGPGVTAIRILPDAERAAIMTTELEPCRLTVQVACDLDGFDCLEAGESQEQARWELAMEIQSKLESKLAELNSEHDGLNFGIIDMQIRDIPTTASAAISAARWEDGDDQPEQVHSDRG